ncbi:hypothetical protein EDB85DRAFT_1903355 [Lactarius pseudohatsudake]|nr:hypothetical protein EDB85DRAFT_1903355 [Lactarius pseudohatsudake]
MDSTGLLARLQGLGRGALKPSPNSETLIRVSNGIRPSSNISQQSIQQSAVISHPLCGISHPNPDSYHIASEARPTRAQAHPDPSGQVEAGHVPGSRGGRSSGPIPKSRGESRAGEGETVTPTPRWTVRPRAICAANPRQRRGGATAAPEFSAATYYDGSGSSQSAGQRSSEFHAPSITTTTSCMLMTTTTAVISVMAATPTKQRQPQLEDYDRDNTAPMCTATAKTATMKMETKTTATKTTTTKRSWTTTTDHGDCSNLSEGDAMTTTTAATAMTTYGDDGTMLGNWVLLQCMQCLTMTKTTALSANVSTVPMTATEDTFCMNGSRKRTCKLWAAFKTSPNTVQVTRLESQESSCARPPPGSSSSSTFSRSVTLITTTTTTMTFMIAAATATR